ncbi:ribosome maturation factor RimP [Geotoga petraea]|jgi:ribosome maturation factor RimP|uniref:Ribosome maturation factor RimP n=1 Tax=Geotoga petraea TaxID=28234 RepID=A0A1G6MB16_9BACT|nr:ribosome maturation factor RimP [Geotoga petraea]MDK2946586.1 ribosome maturation factor RimP [Geotoga sp.]TGG87458.1 ribosome maturation factor RimP [Geotoga petraea]SDC52517.1 ribosome maturation factor RimP [Geotoga petraea]
MSEDFRDKIIKKSEEIAKSLGLELFEINITGPKRKKNIEITIDHPKESVSIEMCEKFSREIEPWFDSIDIPFKSYNLIVSSPGIDRALRGLKDYKRFKNRLAKFILSERIENRTVFIGHIKDADEERVIVHERDSKKDFEIPINTIKKANLEIDL